MNEQKIPPPDSAHHEQAIRRFLRRLGSLLDRQNECGGLLMAAGEQPLGDWQSNLSQINLPRLRWRSARAWALLAASIVFVGITLLVPVRFAALNNGHSLNVGKETETL